MKKIISLTLMLVFIITIFAGCGEDTESTTADKVKIELSDFEIKVDGKKAATDNTQAVYTANDIVYYEQGHDFTYGEGKEGDAHSKEEADKHTVVHIAKAGTYILSGKLSAGQIAVDLGDGAKNDEKAVVTLILDAVDITCSVAPAVIFYNVYECGDKDTEKAKRDVDTTKAGANVIIADRSINRINGSHVARIYDPETVVLNEAGTEVQDADKLHKYDGAFYSKRTMNISGEEKGNGILKITADNEGLDSELHLTINGGIIDIKSGNDGINTNEDGVSVTTINGGELNIKVTGETGEGDGIDSNGWLVINGGTVIAQACAISGDAGIDSDMGIHINGGTVVASGNMLDRISESKQNYAVFQFTEKQKGKYTLKNSSGNEIAKTNIENDFQYLIISNPELEAGDYTLWQGDNQLEGAKSQNGGMGDMRPEMPNGEMPEGMEPPKDFNPDNMPQLPDGEVFPERPDGIERPEKPNEIPGGMEPSKDFNSENMHGGSQGYRPGMQQNINSSEKSKTFSITEGGNYFII